MLVLNVREPLPSKFASFALSWQLRLMQPPSSPNWKMADSFGPNEGLKALFMVHRAELIRFIVARSGDEVEADDLMQELWLKLAKLKPGPIAHARAYLFQMANNLVLDHRRSKRRAMSRDLQWSGKDGDCNLNPAERADPALTADQVLSRDQEIEALRSAIEQLPPRSQIALRLYRLEGLSQSEIAKQMGISRSGVEKHLAVAMRHLRIALEDCGLLQSVTSSDRRSESKGLSEMEQRS